MRENVNKLDGANKMIKRKGLKKAEIIKRNRKTKAD